MDPNQDVIDRSAHYKQMRAELTRAELRDEVDFDSLASYQGYPRPAFSYSVAKLQRHLSAAGAAGKLLVLRRNWSDYGIAIAAGSRSEPAALMPGTSIASVDAAMRKVTEIRITTEIRPITKG